MTHSNPLRVGIAGCGNIAGPYAHDMGLFPEIKLVGVADLQPERAEALAAKHGCTAYPSLQAMLADETIDLIVNLTVHHAHYEVNKQALLAGKHVHSEKPLALRYAEAKELVDLAAERNLRLSASPFTVLGEAQQTAWAQIRDGRLGTVRLAYAEVNWGRIETWHPEPQSFYDVGPLVDVGVYPLMVLTSILGPVARVQATGRVLMPDRVTKHGEPFTITTPDFMVTMLEMADGSLVRLTTNFYVTQKNKQGSGIEFHGDKGSLYLASWHLFNSEVQFAEFGQPYEPVPLPADAYDGLHWGYGVRDVAQALAGDTPHHSSGEQAAHIVEVLEAAATAVQTGQPVEIISTFTAPQPLESST